MPADLPAALSTAPLVRAGTAAFRLASRLRGERAIHARGRTVTGRLAVPGGAATGAPLIDRPGAYDVLVRFSRGAGLPPRLPDVLGLAIRVLDAYAPGAHQDLLLDSTREPPLLRRVPWPGRDYLSHVHGSLLPYDVAGQRVLLGARALPGQSATDLDRLPDSVGLELLLATPHGPWRPWGEVRTGVDLPAPQGRRIRFNPWTTGGGIRPAGPWQGWRRRAYDAVHVGPDAL